MIREVDAAPGPSGFRLKKRKRPEQRVEVKLEKTPASPAPSENEKEAAPRKRFSPKGFRSMNAIDEVIKEETQKSGGDEELLGGEDMPNTPIWSGKT